MRMKFVGDDAGAKVQEGQKVEKNQGVARAISVSSNSNLISLWPLTKAFTVIH